MDNPKLIAPVIALAAWAMRSLVVAVAVGACSESSAVPIEDAVFWPETQVDIVAPDTFVLDTLPDTFAPDTVSDTDLPDTMRPDSWPTTNDTPDTRASDTVDTTPADTVDPVATCPTPTLMESFPPPWPPSPYGDWPHAEGCIGGRHDVIIVLGCPSKNDGSPARCQERRAEMADWLYESDLAQHVIVTGAAVHTPFVEADAIAELLIGRGVPETAIVKEPLARHTDENLYYSSRIMEARGWRSALVVSDDPGHFVYTGLCDANCCVKLGRLTLWSFDVGRNGRIHAGHYALSPPGPGVSEAECTHLAGLLLCSNLDSRKACKDDFRLE